MLKELIYNKRYSFYKEFKSWQEAVEVACKPLLEEGAILPSYIDSIIANIDKYGPYIVIAPNICIPHAQQGQGVNKTAICFMNTEKPVHFSDSSEHDARIFFVLASSDNDTHLKNLSSLVEVISDEKNIEILLNAKSVEDLKQLI